MTKYALSITWLDTEGNTVETEVEVQRWAFVEGFLWYKEMIGIETYLNKDQIEHFTMEIIKEQ